MVFTNKHTQTLINRFPHFANSISLREAMELYADGEQVNIYTVFTGLTDYIIDELISKNQSISQEERDIYDFVEQVREQYSNSPHDSDEFDFDNAACTCFLENLINRASADRIQYSRFIPYLGEKSKEYCRAWDEFTGVKSPGLW